MRNLLLILTIFFTITTSSQYRRTLIGQELFIQDTPTVDDISNFDIGFQNILNEAINRGAALPTVTDQRRLNDIYIAVKAEGLLAGDFFYHFENNGDFTFKRINWSNPKSWIADEVGLGEMINSSNGIKSDGINYFETHRIPTHGVNDATIIIDVTIPYVNDGALFEADYKPTPDSGGLQNTMVGANSTYQYFNSDATNRVTASNSGVGLFSFTRDLATDVDVYKDGVFLRTDTYNSVQLPNDSYKLLRGNTAGRGDSTIGMFASVNAITGKELAIYNAIKNTTTITVTGGINSTGYTPLNLTGSYGISTAGVFTFDKVAAGITEGVVKNDIAKNNRDIISEAIRVAVEVENDTVFDFGDLDCYVWTPGYADREDTRAHSIQASYDGLRVTGNYATTILRMQPHNQIAGAIFDLYKASDMQIDNITFKGEKHLHNYDNPYTNAPHEFPSAIVLEGAPNLIIDNILAEDFTGDGLSVLHSESRNGDGTLVAGEVATTNLMVRNSSFLRNRRNNISYIDADGFTLNNCILRDAGEGGDYNPSIVGYDWRGVLPRCNIDFEATRNRDVNCNLLETQLVRNGVVTNNTFTGAWLSDLNFYTCYDIEVYGNTFTSALAVPVVANRLLIHDNTLTYDPNQANYSFGIYLKSYTNTCILVSENGQHQVYNNTITGFDYGIHITDLGSNVYNNTITNSNLVGIVTSGINTTITNNSITSNIIGSKAYDTPSGVANPVNVIVSGGTANSQQYGARIFNALATGTNGLTFDVVTFQSPVYIQNSDSITIKNSSYPSLTQTGSTNITLTNNTIP